MPRPRRASAVCTARLITGGLVCHSPARMSESLNRPLLWRRERESHFCWEGYGRSLGNASPSIRLVSRSLHRIRLGSRNLPETFSLSNVLRSQRSIHRGSAVEWWELDMSQAECWLWQNRRWEAARTLPRKQVRPVEPDHVQQPWSWEYHLIVVSQQPYIADIQTRKDPCLTSTQHAGKVMSSSPGVSTRI